MDYLVIDYPPILQVGGICTWRCEIRPTCGAWAEVGSWTRPVWCLLQLPSLARHGDDTKCSLGVRLMRADPGSSPRGHGWCAGWVRPDHGGEKGWWLRGGAFAGDRDLWPASASAGLQLLCALRCWIRGWGGSRGSLSVARRHPGSAPQSTSEHCRRIRRPQMWGDKKKRETEKHWFFSLSGVEERCTLISSESHFQRPIQSTLWRSVNSLFLLSVGWHLDGEHLNRMGKRISPSPLWWTIAQRFNGCCAPFSLPWTPAAALRGGWCRKCGKPVSRV